MRCGGLQYGATGWCTPRHHSCTTVRGGASDVRHDEDENFGDNYFIIFNRDLVRDQDEVYIYATLMEYKRALLYILPTLTATTAKSQQTMGGGLFIGRLP